MTDEVVDTTVIVAKDESDWAMDYAEERSRRVKAERRLKGLTACVMSLCLSLDKLFDELLFRSVGDQVKDRQKEDPAKLIMQVITEQIDAEFCTHATTWDPPWGISDATRERLAEVQRGIKSTELDRHFKEMNDIFMEAFSEVWKEWKFICQENDWPDPDRVKRDKQMEAFVKMAAKNAADEAIAERIAEASGEADGEKQKAKTH